MLDAKEYLLNKSNVENLFPKNIMIDSTLASGGQGVVYRGTVSGDEAAIKIYYPGQVQNRIDREVEALAKFDNPHIVKLLWSDKIIINDLELPAVATSLIIGEDLKSRISTKPLANDEIGKLLFDISDAINTMWKSKIVHRDLKPPNIMIATNGRTCVIDLGVARHVDLTPLTATGVTWGTMGYMSPEQTKAMRQLTCKSDIFALGVVAIECALGKHPSRQDQLRLLSMNLQDQLIPQQLESWEFAPLLKKMLHPRPTKRPLPQEILTNLSKYA